MRVRRAAASFAAGVVSLAMLTGGSASALSPGGGLASLPVPGSVSLGLTTTQGEIDWEFAQIMQASGISDDELCLVAGSAPGATHVFQSDVSDETFFCDATVNVAQKLGLGAEAEYELVAADVTGIFQRASHLDCGLTSGYLALACVQYWKSWANLILPGSADWFAAWLFGTPWTAPGGQPGTGTGGGQTPPPPPPLNPPPATEIDLVVQRITATNPQIPTSTATDTAKRCVAEEVAAGDVTQPCLREPIFVPGADAGRAAVHDESAITSNPTWFKLTYLNGQAKADSGVPSGWYDRAAYKGVCPDGASLLGLQCDEYPFYSTVQGGPGASLKPVPVAQNRLEGRRLQSMQETVGCNMATSTGTRPYDYPGAGIQSFLTVPMAVPVGNTFIGPPTFWVCGFPQSLGGGNGGGGGGGIPS